jgi:hypothetical protein
LLCSAAASVFQYVKAAVTVDDVYQSAVIDIGVIGLRAWLAAAGFRDVPADFLRG